MLGPSLSPNLERGLCLPHHRALPRESSLPAATQSLGCCSEQTIVPAWRSTFFLSLFVGFIIFVTGGAARDELCLQGDLAGGEMIRKATILLSSQGMWAFIHFIFLTKNLF